METGLQSRMNRPCLCLHCVCLSTARWSARKFLNISSCHFLYLELRGSIWTNNYYGESCMQRSIDLRGISRSAFPINCVHFRIESDRKSAVPIDAPSHSTKCKIASPLPNWFLLLHCCFVSRFSRKRYSWREDFKTFLLPFHCIFPPIGYTW